MLPNRMRVSEVLRERRSLAAPKPLLMRMFELKGAGSGW